MASFVAQSPHVFSSLSCCLDRKAASIGAGPSSVPLVCSASGNGRLVALASVSSSSSSSSSRSSDPRTRASIVRCQAQNNAERVATSRKIQLNASQLLAQLLQADNLQQVVVENLDSVTEDFLVVTSTYMEMAKKEGNEEVAKQLRGVLEVAMMEKEKTLRPEIRLLNKLIRDKNPSERMVTIQNNGKYLQSDSYFFTLLNRMALDVEHQPPNDEQRKLLTKLKSIQREAKEASLSLRQRPTAPAAAPAAAMDGAQEKGEDAKA
eukprot:jgi/Mesen1/7443/ME000389S06783